MNSWSWYVSQFPESMFLCSQQNKNDYVAAIVLGKDIAKNSNVLICGIVRNSEKVLPYTIARIEKLGLYFKSYHVFLYENDSIDNTVNILTKWKKENNNIEFKSDKLNPPPFVDMKGHDRLKYMAIARNEYLEYGRKYIVNHSVDYVIIVDCDLVGGWSYHGILNSLGQQTYWDVIGSNGIIYIQQNNQWLRLFYDTWAFRTINQPQEIKGRDGNLFLFHRGESLIKVNSCFSGMAIYKPPFLTTNINYTDKDCDHTTLHNELVEKHNYNIYLNPSQIILYNRTMYVV